MAGIALTSTHPHSRLSRHSLRRASAASTAGSLLSPSPSPQQHDPLVVVTPPPQTFVLSSSSADEGAFFTVTVTVPRCCRQALRQVVTSVPLVVELR